jgi:hypothetical protein
VVLEIFEQVYADVDLTKMLDYDFVLEIEVPQIMREIPLRIISTFIALPNLNPLGD